MSLAVITAVALTGVWFLIVGELSLQQAAIGLAFGGAFVLATGAGRGRRVPLRRLPARIGWLLAYAALVLWVVTRANIQLARRLLTRRPRLQPGIIRMRLADIGLAGMALEEHAMTLSPGQLVVDYGEDVRDVYLHTVDVEETRRELPGLRRHFRKLLEKGMS